MTALSLFSGIKSTWNRVSVTAPDHLAHMSNVYSGLMPLALSFHTSAETCQLEKWYTMKYSIYAPLGGKLSISSSFFK
jgi:hypothetical protein